MIIKYNINFLFFFILVNITIKKMSDNDYVRNPNTGRMVKIGGASYRRLINEGVLKNKRKDPRVAYNLEQGDDVDAIKKQLKTQIKLKKGETIRKGAGRNKGKLMIAYKGGRYKNSQGYNSDSSSESDSSSSEDDLAAFCKKLQLEPPRAKQTRKKARESSSESESESESEESPWQ
jgi:hypothetical protein